MEETWKKDNFLITTDKKKLNLEMIFDFIKKSYWGKQRTKEQVTHSIQYSYCYGVFDNSTQIGFARVITDRYTFAYLADVFILDTYQKAGLGKWLLSVILNAEYTQHVKSWMLLTADAHGLYEQFGFHVYKEPQKVMHLHKK